MQDESKKIIDALDFHRNEKKNQKKIIGSNLGAYSNRLLKELDQILVEL
jgi:hypothetical protein